MKYYLLIFIGFLSFFGWASTPEKIAQAETYYNQKDYQQSVKILESIIEEQPYQEIAHYNLANNYYKMGQVGKSIYHYEKALKINPKFEEARNNLSFANKLKLDTFEGMLPITKSKMFYEKFNRLKLSDWALFSGIFSVLVLGCFLVYYFSQKPLLKKIALSGSFVFLIAALLFFFVLNRQQNYLEETNYGVVMTKETSLQKAPRENAESRMKIHEGTTFYIENQTDRWYQIQLANDSIGYIKKSVAQVF